jgi:hypothetical protein
VDFFDFVFTRYLGITKNHMKIMGQHLIIFSIENPCISLTLLSPHHLGITKIHMKTMGQHLVIISRTAALRDTLTLEGDPECPNICPTIFYYYVRALDRCYQYTAL